MPAPQKEDGLPAPWERVLDEASGELYYYNTETGESQWEPPAAADGGDGDGDHDLGKSSCAVHGVVDVDVGMQDGEKQSWALL